MTHGPAKTTAATAHDPGSLGAAIDVIARSAGVTIDADALSATMGWPWLICAGADDTCPRNWHRLARDAFFIEAGRALGLTLRELHPHRAARGLDALPEFAQHFDASYKPLILRALEHDQPVIISTPDSTAPGNAPTWRAILSAETRNADAFNQITTHASSATIPSPTPGPPTQVYVVECASATGADFDRLLSVTLDHARRALAGEADNGFGVVTGPRACDGWIRLLRDEKPCPACGQTIESCLEVFAGAIAREHGRLLRFLDGHMDDVPATARHLFATIEATSRDVIGALDRNEALAADPRADAVADLRASLVRLSVALDARAR
jgi:hypothetical protein